MVNNSLQDILTKEKELDYANETNVQWQETKNDTSYTFTQSGLAIMIADRATFPATDVNFYINGKQTGLQYLGFNYCRFCMSFFVSNGDIATIKSNEKCTKKIMFIPYK